MSTANRFLPLKREQLLSQSTIDAGREALMLSLAIILTIVCAVMFGVGIGLAGYVIATKIREARYSSGASANTAENASTP